MLDLLSDDYEAHLLQSITASLQLRALHAASCVGIAHPEAQLKDTQHGTAENQNAEPSSSKQAFTSTSSHLLMQCKDIERDFESACRSVQAPQTTTPNQRTSASGLLKEQQLKAAKTHVRQVASNDTLPPQEKRLAAVDGLRRSVAVDAGPPHWEAASEYLALLMALDTMVSGPLSLEMLLNHLDAAVAYCCQHRYEAAIGHAQSCHDTLCAFKKEGRVALRFPPSYIRKRLHLVRAMIHMNTKNPEVSFQYAVSAWDEAAAVDADIVGTASEGKGAKDSDVHGVHVVYDIMRLVAAGISGRGDADLMSSLQRIRPKVKSVTELTALYVAYVVPHVELLSEIDAELRRPTVKSAKEKLLAQVAAAASQKQFREIRVELTRVAGVLKDKLESLQLALIRQVDCISSTITDALKLSSSMPLSPVGARSLGVLALVLHRSLVVGARADSLKKRGLLLLSGVEVLLGVEAASFVCFDMLAASVAEDPPAARWSTAAAMRQAVCDTSALGSTAPTEAAADAAVLLQRFADSDSSELDEDDVHELDASWRGHAERFVALMVQDGEWDDDHRRMQWLQLLGKCYAKDSCTVAQRRAVALQAAVASRLFGPVSIPCQQYTMSYKGLLGKVDTPTIQPSWGVQRLMTPVMLQCGTPYAEMFFSVSDRSQSDAVTLHCTRYSGPFLLDKKGRLVVRAFAMRDGSRSATIEACFTVQ